METELLRGIRESRDYKGRGAGQATGRQAVSTGLPGITAGGDRRSLMLTSAIAGRRLIPMEAAGPPDAKIAAHAAWAVQGLIGLANDWFWHIPAIVGRIVDGRTEPRSIGCQPDRSK